MLRTIVHIDEELCNGCGACVDACHEGAIALVNGKARLMRDDYCDGLGDCLPACPMNAITFEKREAAAYDEAAVARHLAARNLAPAAPTPAVSAPAAPHGCPGSAPRVLRPPAAPGFGAAPGAVPAGQPPMFGSAAVPGGKSAAPVSGGTGAAGVVDPLSAAAQAAEPSQLSQWPCQIKLVSPGSSFFQGADLLIATDCTAFACASFHRTFMAGRVTVIGCPKLDAVDYSEKLTAILVANDIRSVTLARMEVPCCGALASAAQRAIAASGKDIPFAVVTVSCDGRIL